MSDINTTRIAPYDPNRAIYSVRFKQDPENHFTSAAQAVAQYFTKILLTTPGTDRFNPDLGGGLRQYLSLVRDAKDPFFKMEIQRIILLAKEQLVEYQREDEDLADDEKLFNATFLGVQTEEDIDVIRIRIQTVSGNVLDISIAPNNRGRLWPE